ncbi:MAG: bifunctional (p)ppGpp synthetase/guanosine-3',5'-bis(diphosphate) 3'-pyrophosphohydrolase [Leptospiraceae bacterium]|nr:bifunctional (p)ppGpp synthetase/guanosine-3',5'-bis(diphosphate) 3'-pyrophosphohydrolase [Leptospiraceae bacterium]
MSIKILASYRQLLKTFRERVPEGEEELIKRAFQFAYRAHRDQKRLSGEPYIIHPIAVSQTLAELGLDTATVAAGLLHDVVEDTHFGEDFIKREFGEEIQNLVKAVTKISLVKKDSVQQPIEGSLRTLKEKEAAENIRLMLLATARDVRVILIKLSDKLHNMRTLQFQKPEKVQRIARETLNIYAPIAGRLGMFGIKSELEDLAFASLDPDTYKEIVVGLKQSRSEREDFIKKLRKILQQRLADINITARVEGRAKHIYSISQKMNRDNRDLHRVYDLRGVRIIVDEVRDCYGALGIVHTLWPPVPGRFKDYIAMPKINGYQSLHTTVVGPDGKPLEVQIRTRDMDERAVFGIAAHWLYKSGSKEDRRTEKLKWLTHLSRLTQEFHGDTNEFIEDLRHELNPHEVFVFTPRGEILNLPVGATVLDFAFRIHTDIGLRCRGAIVNDRMVPLRTELKSGDRVEILTNAAPNPSPVWLRYVNSPRAGQKLRAYFRKQEEDEPDFAEDRPGPEKQLEKQPIRIRRRKSSDPKKVPIEVAGATDIPVRYAGCCSPVPGDRIIGFVTRGRGVTVHRADCPHIPSDESEKDRLISVRWEGLTETYPVQIEIDAEDRQGLYLDLVGAIARTQTNILKAQADIPRNHRGTMKATFLLEVEHVDQLNDIRETLQSIPGVYEVRRVLGPGVGPEKVAGESGGRKASRQSGQAKVKPVDGAAADAILGSNGTGSKLHLKKKQKNKEKAG